MPLAPGTELNGYKIIKTLGEGGFASTYLAEKEPINLTVCIKELNSSGLNEGKILGSVKSPNVVRVLDYFEENDKSYIVLEYLEGQTLSDYVKKNGAIEPQKLFVWAKPLLKALEEIHGKGLIHRDIAPDNIMITAKDGGKTDKSDILDCSLKLFDFGTARNIGENDNSRILKDGFSPIEQVAGDENQGAYSDIYSLCATLYYCLTGKKPESAYSRLLDDDLKKPSELGCGIDSRLENILMKGLSVKYTDRYQTAKEMLQDIERVLPTESKADSNASPGKEKSQRKKRIPTLCLAAFAAIAVLTMFVFGSFKSASPKYDSETMYKIKLTPTDEFTVAGYNESIKTLEERLKLFSVVSGSFYLEENGGTLSLILNKSDFLQNEISDDGYKSVTVEEDSIPEYVLRAYLTRAVSLSLVPTGGGESIAVDGTSEISVKPMESDTGIKLDVSFSDAFLEENGEKLKNMNNSYSLRQDEELSPPVTPYKTEPKEDGSGFYIVSDDNESFLELLEYNLTHEPLEQSFEIEIEEQISWQSDEADFGENQVKNTDFSADEEENSVTYIFKGVMSDGERIDCTEILKKRLDAIGVKYALGNMDSLSAVTVGCDAPIYSFLAVKTSDKRLFDTDIADLALLGNKFYLCTKSGEYSEQYIMTSLYNSDSNEISVSDFSFSKSLSDKQETVYLCYLNGYKLLAGKYDESGENFVLSSLANGEEITEENSWVAKLIYVCINNQYPVDLTVYNTKAQNEDNLKTSGLFELAK